LPGAEAIRRAHQLGSNNKIIIITLLFFLSSSSSYWSKVELISLVRVPLWLA